MDHHEDHYEHCSILEYIMKYVVRCCFSCLHLLSRPLQLCPGQKSMQCHVSITVTNTTLRTIHIPSKYHSNTEIYKHFMVAVLHWDTSTLIIY